MMPPDLRFPIRITPTRSHKSDSDIAVTYTFGDGSIGVISFSAKGHAFEGVKERYAAHRGEVLMMMDDFQSLVADIGSKKQVWRQRRRDHGHEASICGSYDRSHQPLAHGLDVAYVWEAAQLFLRTKEALEHNRIVNLSAYSGGAAMTSDLDSV
jgi:hypothetical protein